MSQDPAFNRQLAVLPGIGPEATIRPGAIEAGSEAELCSISAARTHRGVEAENPPVIDKDASRALHGALAGISGETVAAENKGLLLKNFRAAG